MGKKKHKQNSASKKKKQERQKAKRKKRSELAKAETIAEAKRREKEFQKATVIREKRDPSPEAKKVIKDVMLDSHKRHGGVKAAQAFQQHVNLQTSKAVEAADDTEVVSPPSSDE